ncbi:MAG: hypothetical protein IJ493_00220 [Clostridia bacterium]|nr:hypothetical protein [Clostridia bacterium]
MKSYPTSCAIIAGSFPNPTDRSRMVQLFSNIIADLAEAGIVDFYVNIDTEPGRLAADRVAALRKIFGELRLHTIYSRRRKHDPPLTDEQKHILTWSDEALLLNIVGDRNAVIHRWMTAKAQTTLSIKGL